MIHPQAVVALPGTDAHILSTSDGCPLLRLSSGKFLRIQDSPTGLVAALTAQPAGAASSNDEIERFLQVLRDEISTWEAVDAGSRWEAKRRNVTLVGHGPIVNELGAVLKNCNIDVGHFATAQDFLDTEPSQPPATRLHLVIAYADSPRQRADWDRLDALAKSGYAWLRAYREGQNCFVDPLSISAEDADSEQVLRRRIAANPTPSPFVTWHESVASAQALSSSERVLLVGRILSVALAWGQSADSVEELRRTLWKFVPATGRISEHSVLGYQRPYLPPEAEVHR